MFHALEGSSIFETPMPASINQLLSETHDFNAVDLDIDLSNLPALDSGPQAMIDFANLLSTDGMMPSSPPGTRRPNAASMDYIGTASMWAEWNAAHGIDVDEE